MVELMSYEYCRNCDRKMFDRGYYGYCSAMCAADFAAKHNLLEDEALEKYYDDEIDRLGEKVSKLECDLEYSQSEEEDAYSQMESVNLHNSELRIKIDELKNLKWEQIERERKEEARENRKILTENRVVKTENEKVKKENVLLHSQNIDLLETIKEMRSYSERFQIIDLGIELDYE